MRSRAAAQQIVDADSAYHQRVLDDDAALRRYWEVEGVARVSAAAPYLRCTSGSGPPFGSGAMSAKVRNGVEILLTP
ncbi:MAG: hypothetical protein R3E83_17890 [Burkholderiaceae bacterium]